MYCINCGFKRSLYDKFCKWCGPSKGWLTPFGANVTGQDINEKKARVARALLNLKDPHTGDEIAFGTINREKICWKVLQIQDDKAFIFSCKPVCYMPYHIPGGDITRSECTLRVWLNSVFINKFFDKKEKTRMIQTNGLVSFYGRD